MSKKLKQISYLSAIIISVGSAVGAGIFFKNGEIFKNAGGSLAFTIAAWIIAGIGIMAIGLSLVEMSSASKSNAGVLEWVKKFAPKKASKFASSYMLLIFLPLNYLAMPIYSVMSLQDAIQVAHPSATLNAWAVAGIGFVFFLWVGIMGYFKLKAAEKLQWLLTACQFVPLILIPIFAGIHTGDHGVQTHVAATQVGLTGFSPWLGLMASIPAILFAVDGFYTVTSLKSHLKDEKKMGSIVAVSVAVLIGFYLLFAILLAVSGQQYYGLDILTENGWLATWMNVMIMMAVIGIANGFAMAVPELYEDGDGISELGFINWTKKVFKIKDSKFAGWWLSIIITVLLYLILVPVGIYGIKPGDYAGYGYETGGLYTLMDLITNFTSLFVFIFIGIAIVGAMMNRKSKKVEVEKKWYFMPAAVIAVVFTFVGAGYMLISSMVDMSGINGADSQSAIVKFVVLVACSSISFIPTYWDEFFKGFFGGIKKDKGAIHEY